MIKSRSNTQYVLDGHTPVLEPDLEKWDRFMESNNRRVARSTGTIKSNGHNLGEITVSTVFLGIDHNFLGSMTGGDPILFETMVFGGPLDGSQERYRTWEEAEQGHEKWIEKVKLAVVTLDLRNDDL